MSGAAAYREDDFEERQKQAYAPGRVRIRGFDASEKCDWCGGLKQEGFTGLHCSVMCEQAARLDAIGDGA